MAIVSKNHNAIPIQYVATGSFLDNGTVKKTILNLGFVPRYFALINETDRITQEVYDGQAAGGAINTDAAGARTLLTTTGPQFIEQSDSGAVGTWTVYETAKGVVGTTSVGLPYVSPTEAVDNSRLNNASERFSGVSIPAALVITNKQFRWVAWA